MSMAPNFPAVPREGTAHTNGLIPFYSDSWILHKGSYDRNIT
jgi:hypothetical protein